MPKCADALRGYAFPMLKSDNFVCTYCGLDGEVWPNWLYFPWDHLLPPGHLNRDHPECTVAACVFCVSSQCATVLRGTSSSLAI